MSEKLDAEKARSRYQLAVRFCETDLMGVVHHANYLIYCEAARVDWLHKRGVSYDAWVKLGIHLPVVETHQRFKMAAMFDDQLVVETTATELTRVSIRFSYKITRDESLICQTQTLLACVGNNLRLKRMPAEIAAVFHKSETATGKRSF